MSAVSDGSAHHRVRWCFHTTAMVADYERTRDALAWLAGSRVLEDHVVADPAIGRRGGMTWIGDNSIELGDPAAQRYYGMAMGFVGDTDDAAWTTANDHASWELEHNNTWFAEGGLPPPFPNGPRRDFIIGSPERWIAAVRARHPEPLRCDHLIVELTTSGMAQADALGGIELFAEQVLPALRAL